MRLITVIAIGALCTCLSVARSQGARPLPRHVNQADQDGYTPLMRAAQRGQVNVVRALLKSGAAADARHPNGPTALMVAAQKGHVALAKVLLAAGAHSNRSAMKPPPGRLPPPLL